MTKSKNSKPKPAREPVKPVRTPGGSYNLKTGFFFMGVGETTGHRLINAGKIKITRVGGEIPRITDEEVGRQLGEHE
jgi:hypothetical protein